MKLVFVLCGLLLLSIAAPCQEIQQQCGAHPNLLRDSSGDLKWFTSEELQKMATKKIPSEPVAMPLGMKYEGFVTVKLMIDTGGEVVCLWGAAGHPILIPSAVRAVHQWRFKPMKAEYVGVLKIPVNSAAASK